MEPRGWRHKRAAMDAVEAAFDQRGRACGIGALWPDGLRCLLRIFT
jgi:hypothetical protein